MKRNLLTLVALCGAFFSLTANSVYACGYGAAPNPIIVFAQADVALMGKVVRFERQTKHLQVNPKDKNRYAMDVAVVEVHEAFKGVDGFTHVRVAFHRNTGVFLDQEGLFVLTTNPNTPLLQLQRFVRVSPMDSARTQQRNKTLITQFRSIAKLWKNPVASLTCRDAGQRLQATALVLYQAKVANNWDSATGKKTMLDAKVSRRILLNIAEADWNKVNFANAQVSAGTLFRMLGATAKDGWNPMSKENQRKGLVAAKEWCKANADSFRISALVRTN